MATLSFRTNLNCGSCVAKVTPFLNAESSMESWNVNTGDSRKLLTVTGAQLDSALVRAAVEKSGFKVLEEIASSEPAATISWFAVYFPLLLIVSYLLLGTALAEISLGGFHIHRAMNHFMGGFFLVFSFFKLLNLRAFAAAYKNYDLLAAHIPGYGLLYPFLELSLGAAYLSGFFPWATNLFTLVLMLAGSLGIALSLRKGTRIECACLGTVFKLPMSTVTLLEDLLMAAMAGVMLV